MPIFEFICNTCATGRRFSALVGVVADARPAVCPKCGGADLRKTVSRFARVRSEDESLDALAEAADGIDDSDPRAVRRLMKDMASEMGDDMDADEFEAAMEESMDGATETADD